MYSTRGLSIATGIDGKTRTVGTNESAYKLGEEHIIGRNDALAAIVNLVDNVKSTIGSLVNMSADGNFSDLNDTLTYEKYCELSEKLYKNYEMGNTNVTYECIRLISRDTLVSIYQGVSQYKELVACLNNLKKCEDKASILDDIDKLKEYISKLKSNISVIPDQKMTMDVAPSIAEPFNTYIRLFGFPDKAIFNPDILGLVKETRERVGDKAYELLEPQKELIVARFNATIITA